MKRMIVSSTNVFEDVTDGYFDECREFIVLSSNSNIIVDFLNKMIQEGLLASDTSVVTSISDSVELLSLLEDYEFDYFEIREIEDAGGEFVAEWPEGSIVITDSIVDKDVLFAKDITEEIDLGIRDPYKGYETQDITFDFYVHLNKYDCFLTEEFETIMEKVYNRLDGEL